jgi:hypothetical protein
MPKLGSKLDQATTSSVTQGAPPVVMAVQSTSYVRISKPDDLLQWEKDMHDFYGITVPHSGMAHSASESCSGGCSDDCDLC